MRWNPGDLRSTHDHVWTHIGELRERGDTHVVIAEPNQTLLDKACDEYAIDDLFPDYPEMLQRATPDAVLIFTDNAGTASLVELTAPLSSMAQPTPIRGHCVKPPLATPTVV